MSFRSARKIVGPTILAGAIGSGIITGCSAADSVPSASATSTLREIRQVDDAGRPLPFRTKFPDRWNRANNGTAYEPCTALSEPSLERLQVVASSVRDAAGTNGQTLRGCEWEYRSVPGRGPWHVSQIVGNSPSLAHDKTMKSAPTDVWLPDEHVRGREVGVHYTTSGRYCATYVQSGRAAVDTIVSVVGKVPPSEICDRALEFTRATISKMPL